MGGDNAKDRRPGEAAGAPGIVDWPPAATDSSGLPVVPLATLLDDAAAIAEAADAPNTTAAYESDQGSWEAFCRTHGFTPYPAAAEHVRLYLVQIVKYGGRRGHKLRPRSAQRHLVGIAAAHLALDLPFDQNHPDLIRTLRGLKRRHGVRQQGAAPLRTEAIVRMVATMGLDPLAVRDRALILIGFAGGFRRSALVSFDVGDVAFDRRGLILRLARDKDDQDGEGREIGIMAGENPETCPVRALRAWWRVVGHANAKPSAPLFVPVDRWGTIDILGERLADQAVDRAVKRWAARIGLKGKYSAHSLRVGHVTEARDRGGRDVRAGEQLGHANEATTDRYDRALLWERNSSGFLGL